MNEEFKHALAKGVVRILRPMVRLLIRFEFTQAELSELVRQTYVEVADQDFTIEGEEMTISRVAVLTGLSRKEVVRLRELLVDNAPNMKLVPNRAQRVVQGWLHDKEFLDRKKVPKILPVKGNKGSFVTLVKRYSGDITYGAILDELNRIGVTSQPDDLSVELINTAYIPYENDLEQVRVLSMCVADLLQTGVSNIDENTDEKRFQRQVTFNLLDEKTAHEFRQYSTKKATALIEDLNQFLTKKRAKLGKKTQGSSMRIGMGVYHVEQTQSSIQTDKKSKE